MKIRVGIEGDRRPVLREVRALGAPVLVSANSLWEKDHFRTPRNLAGLDVALDSGGFVAMKRYGGYRWSVEQYAQLALSLRPAWWAQMDFCCEPEIAADKAAVFARIDRTVEHLEACRATARRIGAPAPLVVLQGWEPRDYTQGPAFAPGFAWPALVGVGSVCRRHVKGPSGLLAVIDALDRAIPRHVQFHLFGVKSSALPELLSRWPGRLGSVDSMAWNMAARWDAVHAGEVCNNEFRAARMRAWYLKQTAAAVPPSQLTML